MQFGVIYLKTLCSTLPYIAFTALELHSCFFGFGIIHKKPHSLTLHELVSGVCSCLVDGAGLLCLGVKTPCGERSSSVPLSVSLSLWAEMSVFPWMCGSVHSQYQFHDVSVMFSPYGHSVNCTSLLFSTQQTTLRLWSWYQPKCLACCMSLLWQGTNCTVGKTDIRIHPQFKQLQRNPYSRMKDISLWSHISLTSCPLPPTAHELICHNTQISQHYHSI
jgi:hypothetical protein